MLAVTRHEGRPILLRDRCVHSVCAAQAMDSCEIGRNVCQRAIQVVEGGGPPALYQTGDACAAALTTNASHGSGNLDKHEGGYDDGEGASGTYSQKGTTCSVVNLPRFGGIDPYTSIDGVH